MRLFSVIANLALDNTLLEHLEFMLTGFGIVLLVLSVLALLTSTIACWFKKFAKPEHKSLTAAPRDEQHASNTPAIITAAVHSVLKQSHRIKTVSSNQA